MREAKQTDRPVGVLFLGWAALVLVGCALFVPNIDQLGLYYDEAFMAQQARDFLEPGREALHPASVRSIEWMGRPFPVRNAAYLGALKSQLLVPAFWLGGAHVETLRIATFIGAWIALLLTMLWARRLFSLPIALIAGLLVATDPSFLFFGRFEWGPFTTNLLCRAAGLWLLTIAWQSPKAERRWGAAIAGGLALGLGIFSRADFALVVAAGGLGVILGHPQLIRESLRHRRAEVILACVGGALASAPMWTAAFSLMGAGGAIADRGDLGFRTEVLWHVLDGTQFLRVMQSGGLFEQAGALPVEGGLLGLAFLVALIIVGIDLVQAGGQHPEEARRDPRRWLWITTVAILLLTLALPGAVRAHHHLNALPFIQVMVACGGEVLWRKGQRHRQRSLQGLALLGLLVLLGFQARTIIATESEILETNGRGRWSPEITTLTAELEATPGSKAVSLDWGFHEPLLFLSEDLEVEEAIWSIPRAFAAGRPWIHNGDQHTHYLVHTPDYDAFGLSEPMLNFARRQPSDSILIQPWTNPSGEVDFYSVRFQGRHQLAYMGSGRFQINWMKTP